MIWLTAVAGICVVSLFSFTKQKEREIVAEPNRLGCCEMITMRFTDILQPIIYTNCLCSPAKRRDKAAITLVTRDLIRFAQPDYAFTPLINHDINHTANMVIMPVSAQKLYKR